MKVVLIFKKTTRAQISTGQVDNQIVVLYGLKK